jgi:hypothetical protein
LVRPRGHPAGKEPGPADGSRAPEGAVGNRPAHTRLPRRSLLDRARARSAARKVDPHPGATPSDVRRRQGIQRDPPRPRGIHHRERLRGRDRREDRRSSTGCRVLNAPQSCFAVQARSGEGRYSVGQLRIVCHSRGRPGSTSSRSSLNLSRASIRSRAAAAAGDIRIGHPVRMKSSLSSSKILRG